MITVRAARWAAMGAAMATVLLAGMAGSAKAQTSGGGTTTPPSVPVPDFVDTPNTNTSGQAAGWDLLSHQGFPLRESFRVTLRFTRDSPYRTNTDGSLAGDVEKDDIWSGASGANALPPDHKAVNTKATMRIQYTTGIGYYEYRLTASGKDANGNDLNPVTVSGGINSYGLQQ